MKDKYKIWLYLCVVFILSYGYQYIIYITGGIESRMLPLVMWIPAIVAVFFITFYREGFRKIGWGLKKWIYIFPAIFIPLAISLGLVFLVEGLNRGSMPENLFVFKNGMLESTKIGLLLGKNEQSIPFFILNLILSNIVILVSGSVLSLGEEFGWRGYLQEKMLRKFGLIWGFVILGAVWGYWHLPINLMGYNYPAHPVLGALVLMPVGTIFLGTFMGWLYLRSKSIWMPVLAHTSINLFGGFLDKMTMSQDDFLRDILWLTAWGIAAFICFINLYKNRPIFWQETEFKTEEQLR